MYYILRNKNENICRIFNCLTSASFFVNKNKDWIFCNRDKGFKRHTDALLFVKETFVNHMILGNNGSVLYSPKNYKSAIDKAFEKINSGVTTTEHIIENEPINSNGCDSIDDMTDIVVAINSALDKEVEEKGNVVEPDLTNDLDNNAVNNYTHAQFIIEEHINSGEDNVCDVSSDLFELNDDSFDFDEDYTNVLEVLCNTFNSKACEDINSVVTRDNIDTIIANRLDTLLAERGIIEPLNVDEPIIDDIVLKNRSIAELPTYVTDINKQLITMLLHLDIFELQRVFSDFSTALVCVDGSYKEGLMAYAYIMLTGGKVIEDADLCCTEGKVLKKIEGTSTQAEFISVRQAIAKAAALGVKDLIICYDCESIISTLSGVSLRTAEQKQLKSFVDTMSTVLNLHFVKVKAHSGVPLHTRADVLAGIKVGRSI